MAKQPKKRRTQQPNQGSVKKAAKSNRSTSPVAESADGADTTPPSSATTKSAPTRSRAQANAEKTAARKSSPMLSWILLGGVIVAIVGGVIGYSIWDAIDGGGDGVTTRTDWDLPARDDALDDDGRVTLAEFSGTPTVVNFYASWCTACDAELPAFRQVAEATDGEVDFVFVNTKETGDWRDMVDNHGIDQFPLARDIGGSQRDGLYRSLNPNGTGMPITAFYDGAGNLQEVVQTTMNTSSITAQLSRLGVNVT